MPHRPSKPQFLRLSIFRARVAHICPQPSIRNNSKTRLPPGRRATCPTCGSVQERQKLRGTLGLYFPFSSSPYIPHFPYFLGKVKEGGRLWGKQLSGHAEAPPFRTCVRRATRRPKVAGKPREKCARLSTDALRSTHVRTNSNRRKTETCIVRRIGPSEQKNNAGKTRILGSDRTRWLRTIRPPFPQQSGHESSTCFARFNWSSFETRRLTFHEELRHDHVTYEALNSRS